MSQNSTPLLRGEPLQSAAVVCVFVHGRGQSPEMMDEAVIRHLKTAGVAYLLPRAPGGAWYAARAVDPLTEQSRGQLAASLEQVKAAVLVACGQASPGTPLLLAGFSQGACLVLEYALKFGPWAGALASLTGCRVGVATDDRPLSDLAGLPVYMTAADADAWIPVPNWAEAAGAMGKAKARLRADFFPGRGHEPSPPEIIVLDKMLASLAARRPLWQEA